MNEYGNFFGDIIISAQDLSSVVECNIYRNTSDLIEITLPSNWELINDEFLLTAKIGNSGMDYFTIIKHNKQDLEMDYEEYFEYVKKSIIESKIEKNIESRQSEYQINSRKVYNLNGYTQLDKTIFAFHSYFLDLGDSIYDIAMRYEKKEEDEINKVIFEMIASSLVIKQKRHLFDEGKTSKNLNLTYQ